MSTVIASPLSTNLATKQAQLATLDEQRNKLSVEIETEKQATLQALPAALGFSDSADFIRTLATVHHVRGFSPVERRNTRRTQASNSTGRKPRTTITPDMKKSIISDFQSPGFRNGRITKEDIMKKYDISAPTAQNLKKEAGMVNTRS